MGEPRSGRRYTFIGAIAVIALILITLLVLVFRNTEQTNDQKCSLSHELRHEIKSYKPIVDKIVAAAVNGPFSGNTYRA